jgi:nitrous oxidase accessory protein
LKTSRVNLIIIIILLAGSAKAATISITSGQSIQAAIDKADQGDTIEVHSGTYYENVNVFKSLFLRGVDHPIINAKDGGSAITLYSGGAVIKGFIFTNSSASKAAINVSGSFKGNIIINNTITKNRGDGIDLWASANNNISGNIISNNRGNGLALWSCENNQIMKNFIINNNGSGIFGGSANGNISDNFIYANNGSGIVLLNSFNNIISMNQASNNKGAGIMLIFSSNNSIDKNTASNNGNSGVSLLFSWKNEITSNAVNENFDGIYLGNSSENNVVVSNKVRSNRLGVHLGSSNNNTIYDNDLNENDFSAYDDGINQWDSGKRGNYYGDVLCPDVNRDAICDSVRTIPGGLSLDRYPLASSGVAK